MKFFRYQLFFLLTFVSCSMHGSLDGSISLLIEKKFLVNNDEKEQIIADIRSSCLIGGSDINQKNKDGKTVLDLTEKRAFSELKGMTLLDGHMLSYENKYNLMNNWYQIRQFLINNGAKNSLQRMDLENNDTEIALSMEEESLLLIFVMQKKIELLDMFFQIYGNNIINKMGYEGTLLHIACGLSKLESVDFLLNNGASWQKNRVGDYPIHSTIRCFKVIFNEEEPEQIGIIRRLLNHGCDINQKNDHREMVLDLISAKIKKELDDRIIFAKNQPQLVLSTPQNKKSFLQQLQEISNFLIGQGAKYSWEQI